MACRAFVLAGAVALAACTGNGSSTPTSAPTSDPTATTQNTTPPQTGPDVGPVDIDPDSHTASELGSVEAFEALAKSGVGGQQVVKFSITDFRDDPNVEWLDSNFYALHDEWYWFQLLNGDPVDGFDTAPVDDLSLDTVADAYAWAENNRNSLPFDLRFTSLGRLYSELFYDTALDDPATRTLGLGSVIRVPERTDPASPQRWMIELEYRDGASAVQIARYFDLLVATLPPNIAEALVWVPRSREQEIVADDMAAAGSKYGDRTIRYSDLVVPGQTEVYAEGVAAGRLLLVTDDGRYSLANAGPNDIVVVQRTPDALPPGNALITGQPQTPLAHVNVLALNRGIPNAFLGGLADNPELSQLGRVRAPVAVRAIAPDRLDIRALTDDEFNEWRRRRGVAPIAVPALELDRVPYVQRLLDVASGGPSEADIDALRPSIGGKAAGFLGLIAPGSVTIPDRPLVITVKAYFEHIARLDGLVEAVVTDDEFTGSTRSRFLLLEGRNDYDERFPDQTDQDHADDLIAEHPPGTPIGDVLAADGIKDLIRGLPIDPGTLDAMSAEIADNFFGFAPSQGLRFRSSSSVEDIEGFNGAGLYDSNTGYLDPTVLPDETDHKRTVERAILRTWSSYWNFEAVEERTFESVDHLSGGMAVLVHARFDDPLEVSNGVATYSLLPDGTELMNLNAQQGAVSVTNPDNEPGQTPEVVALSRSSGEAAFVIERIGASSLVAADRVVLIDAQLTTIADQTRAVTSAWRDRINAELAPEQQVSTLTLDFEFRMMAPGWPAMADGSNTLPRIVIKQARTLEPSLRSLPAELLPLPVPRDVLARTVRAVRTTCPTTGAATNTAAPAEQDGDAPPSEDVTPEDVSYQLFTDPLASVDMGYAVTPLIVIGAGSATRIVDDTCTTDTVFASASDYLQELFLARDE